MGRLWGGGGWAGGWESGRGASHCTESHWHDALALPCPCLPAWGMSGGHRRAVSSPVCMCVSGGQARGRTSPSPCMDSLWLFCLASFISFCFLWDAALGILRRSLHPSPFPFCLTIPPGRPCRSHPLPGPKLGGLALRAGPPARPCQRS